MFSVLGPGVVDAAVSDPLTKQANIANETLAFDVGHSNAEVLPHMSTEAVLQEVPVHVYLIRMNPH